MAEEKKAKKLIGEARVDALVQHLKDNHGFDFPHELDVEEPAEEKTKK